MSSLRRPFLALTLFSLLYVFLALLGVGPGSTGLRTALFGISEDPLWGSGDPPNELKIKLRVQDIRLQLFNLTVMGYTVQCCESPWVLRSSFSREVIILHGSSLPLSTWDHTLRLLSTWGHRSVAVHLPGWAKTESSTILSPEFRGPFVAALIEHLQFSTPVVLVVPSLGGLFAIPYLQRHQNAVGALIGIGISLPAKCSSKDIQELKVRSLALYSEGDTSAARVARLLTFAPRLSVRTVPPAKDLPTSHLLSNPEAVHRIVYHFLLSLQNQEDS